MKKTLLRFSVVLSVLFASCQGDGLNGSDNQSQHTPAILARSVTAPRPAGLELAVVEESGLRLEFHYGQLQIGSARTHGKIFTTIDCLGCGWTNELGKPRLPVLRRFIKVPQGTTPQIELLLGKEETHTLASLGIHETILPVQHPIPKIPGAEEQIPFVIDEEVYSSDAFYPEKNLSVQGPFFIRGHQLYQIEVAQVRFNPRRGEIKVLQQANIQVSFVGTQRVEAQVKPSAVFDSWLAQNVINYAPLPAPRGVSSDKYTEGMLVIVGNAYASNTNLANYIETRRAEGLKVEVVPMSVIGTTATSVRTYIRNQYLSWNNPALTYVVLVGDVADIPVYTGSGGGSSQVTDNYYAAIDPDNYSSDLLAPDLLVSRISVNNANELNTYLDRANKYLFANFPADLSWMKKLSFLASSDNFSITEGTHNYVINTYTAPLGYYGTFPNNPTPGGDKLYAHSGGVTQTVIQNTLGNGRLVINFSGHGDVTEWADPQFTQSYLNNVLPADAIPFVVSNACLTGSFGAGSDCWGEMWLAHSKGAILFWGASNYSYWDEDDILERRMWDGIFQNNITRLSKITRNAKMQLLAHYGPVADMQYYFEEYNELGDGSIDLYTDQPFDAQVLYQNQIPLGVQEVDFNVSRAGSALPGAVVCLRGLGVQQVGVTDSTGHVKLVMNPAPTTVGDMYVTVTAHNMRRYQGTIQVVPAEGPYLSYKGHEITSDGATPVPPNPGRHVVMPVTLHNLGNDAATNISASISSNSQLVAITKPNLVFADIAAGADGRSTTHAEFDISPNALDGATVDFTLSWTASGNYSGTSRFFVAVQKPKLVYHSHLVDDFAAQCDADGIADVYEPATFLVTIKNEGSGSASHVVASLSADSCSASAPVTIGALPSGGTAQAVFTVIPSSSIDCPAKDWPFTLTVQAEELLQPDISSFTETLNADIVGIRFEDNMESSPPNGWSHQASIGTDDWAYVTTSYHSPTHAWFCSDPDSISDKYLLTPVFSIGEVAEMSFWHKVASESGFDGAVIEISVNGGEWQDLGNYITQGGYNSTISSSYNSPIAGRRAWSGSIAWQQVRVNLSSFGPASVQIRFRFASDRSLRGEGWWIDDFVIDAQSVECQQQVCNQPPVADAGDDQEVESGTQVTLDGSRSTDPEGAALQYTWTQKSGTAVVLSGADSEKPTFIAPVVAGSEILTFELTVSDGMLSASDTVNVKVWNCDDGEPCTTDIFTGSGCRHEVLSDCTLCGADGVCMNGHCQVGGQSQEVICDDADACTRKDICQGGKCVGTEPVICQALDQCHLAGECNPADGSCSNPEKPDGSVCDDGNACTQTDTCQSGSCVGENPVVCQALDQCHVAGECDPATGLCSNPEKPDGTPCDDGDACTRSDSCQGGVCVGTDAVECVAPDQCHGAECNPVTGECEYPALTGTACDDGNACTRKDTCQAGQCVGADPVVCQAEDECHLAGQCDPQTGQCSNPLAPDGTSCSGGECRQGECVSTSGGCGCSSEGSAGRSWLALVLAAALLRKKRR